MSKLAAEALLPSSSAPPPPPAPFPEADPPPRVIDEDKNMFRESFSTARHCASEGSCDKSEDAQKKRIWNVNNSTRRAIEHYVDVTSLPPRVLLCKKIFDTNSIKITLRLCNLFFAGRCVVVVRSKGPAACTLGHCSTSRRRARRLRM